MQAAPMLEGMYLHGILHRIEGDYDNARAWYGDVASSAVFKRNWSTKEDGLDFIGKVEALNKRKEGDKGALGKESLQEIKNVVEYCLEKHGKGQVQDASVAWTQPDDEEHKKMAQDMIHGGKGHREF